MSEAEDVEKESDAAPIDDQPQSIQVGGTQEIPPQPAVIQEPVAPSPLIVQPPPTSSSSLLDSPNSPIREDNISPLPTNSPMMGGMGGPDSPGETMLTGRTYGTYDSKKWDGKRSYTTHTVMDRKSAERFGLAMSQEMQRVKSQSRIEVRIISGTHLLASDENGKSDPVCFAWFGNKDENPFDKPDFHNKLLSDEKYMEEHDIHQTGVCKETINPIWNETIIFPCPLDNITTISDLINTNVFIAIKDYDNEDNGIDFDSLGCVQFSFSDIVMNGKITNRKINAIIDNGRTHMIQNDSKMTVKGTLGKIKINLSFVFEDDAINLFKSYPAFDRQNKPIVSFDAFYYHLMSKIDPSKDLGNNFKGITRSISPASGGGGTDMSSRSGLMTSRSGMLTSRTRGSTSKSLTTHKIGRARSLSPGPRRTNASSNDSLFENMSTSLYENNILSVIEESSREIGGNDQGVDDESSLLLQQAVNEELQASQQAIQSALSARNRMDGKKTTTSSPVRSTSKLKTLETIVDSPQKENNKENNINQSSQKVDNDNSSSINHIPQVIDGTDGQDITKVTSTVPTTTTTVTPSGIFSLDIILTDIVIYGMGALLNSTATTTTTAEKILNEGENKEITDEAQDTEQSSNEAQKEVLPITSENPDEASPIPGNEEEIVSKEDSKTCLISWKVNILNVSSNSNRQSPLMSWESTARYLPPTTPDEMQWNNLKDIRNVTDKDALQSFDFENPSLTPTINMSFQILKHIEGQDNEKEDTIFATANFQLPCSRSARSAKITNALEFQFTDNSIDSSSLKGSYLGFSWVPIPAEDGQQETTTTEVICNDDSNNENPLHPTPPLIMDAPTGGDMLVAPNDDENEIEVIPQSQEDDNVHPTSSIFVLRCKKTKTDYKCIFPGSTRIGREAIEDENTGEEWFPHWCPRDEKGAPLSKNYILKKHAEIIIEGSIDNPQIKLRNHSKGGCIIYNNPKDTSTAIKVNLIEDSLIDATFPDEKDVHIADYIQFCPGSYLFQLLQLPDEEKLLSKVVEPFFGFGGDFNECNIQEYNMKLAATYPIPLPVKKLTKSDVPNLGINKNGGRGRITSSSSSSSNDLKSSSVLRSSSAHRKNRNNDNNNNYYYKDDSATSDTLVASGGNVKTVKALQQLTQQRKELEKILKEIKVKSNKYDKRLMALEKKAGLDGSSIFSGSTPGSIGHDVAVSIASDKKSEARAKEQESNNDNNNNNNNNQSMNGSAGNVDGGNESFMPSGGGDEALPSSRENDDDGHDNNNNNQHYGGSGIAGNHFSDKQWGQLEAMIKKGHLTNAFTKVLDHGDFMDLSKLMTLCNGPQPEILSITVRNKLYGRISTMLNNGKEVERNLVWILALVRQNLVGEMVRHTLYDVRTALLHTASEPSKRGMLAALLEDAIKQHQRALYGGRS